MAEVNITISGFIVDKYGRAAWPCTVVGAASLTGLGVGGGPIIPPEGGNPPGIWGGGNEPFPTPPIAFPPGLWPSPNPPHPAHPIVNPPEKPPTEPPTEPPTNPPSPQWVWGYSPKFNSWTPVYVPGPGQPGPKK